MTNDGCGYLELRWRWPQSSTQCVQCCPERRSETTKCLKDSRSVHRCRQLTPPTPSPSTMTLPTLGHKPLPESCQRQELCQRRQEIGWCSEIELHTKQLLHFNRIIKTITNNWVFLRSLWCSHALCSFPRTVLSSAKKDLFLNWVRGLVTLVFSVPYKCSYLLTYMWWELAYRLQNLAPTISNCFLRKKPRECSK